MLLLCVVVVCRVVVCYRVVCCCACYVNVNVYVYVPGFFPFRGRVCFVLLRLVLFGLLCWAVMFCLLCDVLFCCVVVVWVVLVSFRFGFD